MATVLDYSAGIPGAAHIAGAVARGQNVIGAVRYIGFPTRSKCTNRAELEDFSRHGLGMALVYEDSAGDWRHGLNRGRAAAERARNHANQIGFPAGRPIYLAVDQDVVTAAEFAAMVEYLRGASEVLGGPHLTGVYGEHDVCDRAARDRVATWFWQTRAWSGTPIRFFDRRHLFQHPGTVVVNKIPCDVNDVMRADWGQHNMQEDDELALKDDLDGQALIWRIEDFMQLHPAVSAGVAKGQPLPVVDLLRGMADELPAIKTMLSAVIANQQDDLSEQDVLDRLDAGIRETSTKAINDALLPALQRIEEALERDDAIEAKAIVAELAERLRRVA